VAVILRCSRTSLSGHRRLSLLENEFSFPTAGTKCGIIDKNGTPLLWRIDEFSKWKPLRKYFTTLGWMNA